MGYSSRDRAAKWKLLFALRLIAEGKWLRWSHAGLATNTGINLFNLSARFEESFCLFFYGQGCCSRCVFLFGGSCKWFACHFGPLAIELAAHCTLCSNKSHPWPWVIQSSGGYPAQQASGENPTVSRPLTVPVINCSLMVSKNP